MQSVLTFALLLLSICCALGQIDEDICFTANEEYVEGTCMPLSKCPELIPMIKTDREYLKQYHCGWEEAIPMVCCPPPVTTTARPVILNECVTQAGNTGACVETKSCPILQKMYNFVMANFAKSVEARKQYTVLIKSRCTRPLEPQVLSFCCELSEVFEQ